MIKLVAVLGAALALVGCGGDDFQAPLFEEPNQDGGVDGSDSGLADADAAHQDTGPQNDAMPEADAQPQPEGGEDALPESGPDACVPGTCENLGKNCGPTPDGCGGTIPSCGSCPTNQSCGGGGVANVCGGCVPKTCAALGYKCGAMPDGCGNTITCGPPATFAPNSSCAENGLPPNLWQCGGTSGSTPAFPPPFASCKPYYYYYCCDEQPDAG